MRELVKKLLFSGGAKSLPQEGRVWVCVGTEQQQQQRFELEAGILNHPLFEGLLRLSTEKFGYSYQGALRIACETELFLHLLGLLRSSKNRSVHYMNGFDDTPAGKLHESRRRPRRGLLLRHHKHRPRH